MSPVRAYFTKDWDSAMSDMKFIAYMWGLVLVEDHTPIFVSN